MDRRRAKFEEFMQNATDIHKWKQARAEGSIMDSVLPPDSPVNYKLRSSQTQNQANGGVNIWPKITVPTSGQQLIVDTSTVTPPRHSGRQ